MNLVRTTAVILIILAGAIGSYFILKNLEQAGISNSSAKISELSKAILNKNPIQWVERAKERVATAVNSISEQSSNQDAAKSVNLTDLVSQSMFGGMQGFLQSENASTTFNPNDPKSQEAIQNAINNIKDPFVGYDLFVDEKVIKISQDNSLQNKKIYLNAVLMIVAQNQTDAYKNPTKAVDNAVLSGDASGLQQLANTYKNLSIGFMNLSVPSDWLGLHERYLKFVKKAEAVYSGIAGAQDDPVRASLFVQIVPDVINEEIGIYNEYYKLMTG